MKTTVIKYLVAIATFSLAGGIFAADLSGSRGKIFKVKPRASTFELLKETVFDPRTNEGKSRYTVYWTEKTTFSVVVEQKDFSGLTGPVLVDLNPVNNRHAKTMNSGKDFFVKMLTIIA